VITLLFAAVVWLVLAWKTAGWIGLDRWLLPLLGMPWRGGVLFDGGSEWECSKR
jgi:thiosulfate dehydrogenase [quinone] large subunit